MCERLHKISFAKCAIDETTAQEICALFNELKSGNKQLEDSLDDFIL